MSQKQDAKKIIFDLIKDYESPVILEVGAHRCEDTFDFARIKNSKVHAFEPNVHNIPVEIIPENVLLNRVAISNYIGKTDFNPSHKIDGGIWGESSSIKKPKNHLTVYPWVAFKEPITVDCITLDSYCEKNSIDKIALLWADIQGAEFEMLDGAKDILKNIYLLYTECSNEELYEGQINLDTIIKMLPDFEIVNIWNGKEINILFKNKNINRNE